jgi:serine/threonine protein kinase
MPLASSTRIGAIEIAGPLGAGGMGEIYRARDTRLNRPVAVKLLPDLFASDYSGGLPRLSSARLVPGAEPSFGAPEPLFEYDPTWSNYYAVSPDASRFLLAAPVDEKATPSSVRIVRNWAQEFVKRQDGSSEVVR